MPEGGKVTLTCTSTGSKPPAKLHWYRGDMELEGETLKEVGVVAGCLCAGVSVCLLYFMASTQSFVCVCVCAQVGLLSASADIFSRNAMIWFGFLYKAACFSAGSQ